MKTRKRLRLIVLKMEKARRRGDFGQVDKLYDNEYAPFVERIRARMASEVSQ